MQAPVAGSTTFLLSYPTLISCLSSLALLSSYLRSFTRFLPFFACSGTATFLWSGFVRAWVLESWVVLLLLFILGLTLLYLAFTTFKSFKQALSNKFLRHLSSLAKFLCLFLLFDLLFNKINHKQTFDIAFINLCLLADNYGLEIVDISFVECSSLNAGRSNWLKKLELLNPKLVCIIKAIFFAVSIF